MFLECYYLQLELFIETKNYTTKNQNLQFDITLQLLKFILHHILLKLFSQKITFATI